MVNFDSEKIESSVTPKKVHLQLLERKKPLAPKKILHFLRLTKSFNRLVGGTWGGKRELRGRGRGEEGDLAGEEGTG